MRRLTSAPKPSSRECEYRSERVLESGEREELAPMTPFERKIVHDAVAAVDGVRSESEGAEPARRVVVLIDG